VTLSASVGELVQIQFPCFDVDGITPLTGLVDGDFSKLLLVDNAVSAVAMTVSEVGATGRYVMTFTPNGLGLWYAEVATPVDDVFADQVEVGAPPDDWIDAIVNGVWSEILAGAYPADSAGWRLARVDDNGVLILTTVQGIESNVQDLHDALVMAVLTATGGTADTVETNATQADGFYDDLTAVVRNASGNVSRRIDSYANANGTFTFEDDLPFTPVAGDEVIVLGVLGKVLCESSADVLDKLVEVWQRLGLDPDHPLCITKMEQSSNGWKLVHSEVGDKIIVTREDT